MDARAGGSQWPFHKPSRQGTSPVAKRVSVTAELKEKKKAQFRD